jgi:hypothetical protein
VFLVWKLILANLFMLKFSYDPALADPTVLKSLIEAGSITYDEGGQMITERTLFEVAYITPEIAVINTREYLQKTFRPFDRSTGDIEKYEESQLSVYEMPFAEAIRQDKQRWFIFLFSHLTTDDGVVRMSVRWADDSPVLSIYYVTDLSSSENILAMLTKPNLTVTYADGTTRDFPNPYSFE